MRNYIALTWLLALASLFGLSLTGASQGKSTSPKNDEDRSFMQVIVIGDDKNAPRSQLDLFRQQLRDYNYTDAETGERMSDLLLLTTRVTNSTLTVSDVNGVIRDVLVTRRTVVVLPDRMTSQAQSQRRPNDDIPLTSVMRNGDLVVVDTVLRNNGAMTALRIRVIGQLRGAVAPTPTRPTYGYRYAGDIATVDHRRGFLEVNVSNTRTTVKFERNALILVDGRDQPMSYLRPGDRVVMYARSAVRNREVTVYRLVWISDRDRYPIGDTPYWTDPDYRDDRIGNPTKPTIPVIDGTLQVVRPGYLFTIIDILEANGRITSITAARGIPAFDRNGNTIAIDTLRRGERLRVSYREIDGTFFAERIDLL